MALIEHEARVGLPRMWEHPRRTRTRRGGVVASMVGRIYGDTARPSAIRRGKQYSQAMRKPERGRKMAGRTDGRGRMSGREKPDAPGLWRDANEKTVVACMESASSRYGMWTPARSCPRDSWNRPHRSSEPNGRG